MQGSDERSSQLFSYVDLQDRVPSGHPLLMRAQFSRRFDQFGQSHEGVGGRREGEDGPDLLQAADLHLGKTGRRLNPDRPRCTPDPPVAGSVHARNRTAGQTSNPRRFGADTQGVVQQPARTPPSYRWQKPAWRRRLRNLGFASAGSA